MSDFNFEQFLKISSEFKLGNLTTESFHPLTKDLSSDVLNDLPAAVNTLKEVDRAALNLFSKKRPLLYSLYLSCQSILDAKGRIFLCGCGATGRLALTIETLARMQGNDNIIGFMAGGDYALIKSVESFEDRMSYGSRQLVELGFSKDDLLLAITEGGETSFVIGAALEAQKISQANPFFIYCNPDVELLHLERCRNILENDNIIKLNLSVGPMALSGSTRMQATTVQMLAAGLAVLSPKLAQDEFTKYAQAIIEELISIDYSQLIPFIEKESQVYLEQEIVTYVSDDDLAISILTDTTERSPTFNMLPFERADDRQLSASFMTIAATDSSQVAWLRLLRREPRFLDWAQLDGELEIGEIYKYDISEKSIERRSNSDLKNNLFRISMTESVLQFDFKNELALIPVKSNHLLAQHLVLKLLLNTMSTLIMGKLERYQSNMMTWVKPSNFKLIDRAARYVQELLKQDEIDKEYDDIAKAVIEMSSGLNLDRPIVLEVYQHFKALEQ